MWSQTSLPYFAWSSLLVVENILWVCIEGGGTGEMRYDLISFPVTHYFRFQQVNHDL